MNNIFKYGIPLIIVLIVVFFIFNKESEEVKVNQQIIQEEVKQELLPINLVSQEVATESGELLSFSVAEPFKLAIVAEGLGKARFMTLSPDGRVFVPDLVDYKLSHQGKIFVLEDFNEKTRQFETINTYLSNLRGPNSVAFYTDKNGDGWIYIALTAHLIRYPYEAGDMKPLGEPEIVLEFPNTQAPEAKSVVWHITRTIKFLEDRLYISIGSGCDACEQPTGEMRGMIVSVNSDGTDPQVYANGVRNSVDFTWAKGELYATENGVDYLGADAPNEVMYKIEKGKHYGWPYCYEIDGEVVTDRVYSWRNAVDCSTVPHSFSYFDSRSAPLGIEFFEKAHGMLQNTFLVALHGSFDRNVQHGYKIVRITLDGEQEIFMEGFQDKNANVYARPLDFLQKDENSFFFTDDFGGRIYYVYSE